MSDSANPEIVSLQFNVRQLDARVRLLEKLIDTRDSPWYMRLKWRVWDGFPPWYRSGSARSFRERLRGLL